VRPSPGDQRSPTCVAGSPRSRITCGRSWPAAATPLRCAARAQCGRCRSEGRRAESPPCRHPSSAGSTTAGPGVAADAYRSSLPAQHAALLAIKATGDDVDAALTDLANALTTFWAEISVALANLVAALFAAAVSAATAVGAPTAVAFALAALGIFAAAAKSTVSALTAVATNAASRAAQLERRLSNDAAFPAGGWPRSTTALTDASVADGDDTDWHLP
jgi:hypothetical protein